MNEEQLTLEKMAETYKEHAENDAREFTSIGLKLDKREKIAIVNGEHLSSISKEIAEINKILNNVILPHITAVSPILKEFQDRQETERTLTRLTLKIKRYGFTIVFIGSVITALIVIINFFRFR